MCSLRVAEPSPEGETEERECLRKPDRNRVSLIFFFVCVKIMSLDNIFREEERANVKKKIEVNNDIEVN